MLTRAAERPAVRAAWRIGEPYQGGLVETVRVRLARPLGIPAQRLLRHAAPSWGATRLRWLAATSVAVGLAVWLAGAVLGAAALGALVGAATGGTGLIGVARATRDSMARLSVSDTLEDLGAALAEALASTGVIDERLGPRHVRITSQPDGFYRCYLDGASLDDARAFAEALDELLAPLWDPMAIVPRRVAEAPRGLGGALGAVARRLVGRGPGHMVVYHAVPTSVATSRRRLAAFERAWSRWVSPGARALRSDDPRALAILALRAGDDPFGIETQMRTLWS